MIICDTGPFVSAVNKGEGRRHQFAAELLARLGRKVIVPWPVLVEVDLLLRSRGYPHAAIIFGESVAAGVHRLEVPTAVELDFALELGRRYQDSGADLPDLIVMSMAHHRRAHILTWDFKRFQSVVLRRGQHRPLVVAEEEMPHP